MSERDDQMLLDTVNRVVSSIEAEVAARDLLTDHEGTWWGDVPVEDRQAIAEAREVLELEPFVPNEDAATDVADGLDDLDTMFSDALEIRAEGYRSGYDESWTVDKVRICVGLGGPNLYVYCDGRDAWIDGYWGGSRCEGKYLAPAAADAVNAAVSYFFD